MTCFFFFQAEDGIRDVAVTGVQTCALPILGGQPGGGEDRPVRRARLERGVALLDPGLVDRQYGAGVRAGHRLGPHARGRGRHGYGLTARMIAECTPSPTCWARVMVMLVNPARASPPRYSVK